MSRSALSVFAAAVASALLAGCATGATYHPARGEAAWADGYHETRLEADRWRVVFRGDTLTSRETVETALLYRAAELTRAEGFDWFLAVSRDTEMHADLVARDSLEGWIPNRSPRWSVAYDGAWRPWDPVGSQRALVVSRLVAYEAIAEIVLGRGALPSDPRAHDAYSVIESLQARTIRPGADR